MVTYRAEVIVQRMEDGNAGSGAPIPCETDRDCGEDDGLFCNGEYSCEAVPGARGSNHADDKVCVLVKPCPLQLFDKDGNAQQLCDEDEDACDCNPSGEADQVAWYCYPGLELPDGMHRILDLDSDNRNHDDEDECDDADPRRAKGNDEQCAGDAVGLDEDCDLKTVERLDVDEDKAFDRTCLNRDPATGLPVPVAGVDDCDDERASVRPGAEEICDGYDNDCDGLTDEGPELPGKPPFSDGTMVECRFVESLGKTTWAISACPDKRMWCDETTTSGGCETDISELDHCASCEPDKTCKFACDWRSGCDEVVEVAAGNGFACALTERGVVACWGRANRGQVGSEVGDRAVVPTEVSLPEEAHGLVTGAAHACALVGAQRQVYCWGENESNQLASVSAGAFRHIPDRAIGGRIGEIRDVKELAAGFDHTCATVGEERRIWCWGAASQSRILGAIQPIGEFESDTPSSHPVPIPLSAGGEWDAGVELVGLTGVLEMALGSLHTCVRTAEGVLCWGANYSGQIGVDPAELSEASRPTPVSVPGQVRQLVAGAEHTCALNDRGEVYCWGINFFGELGRDAMDDNYRPGKVAGLGSADIVQLEAGASHTCVVDGDGDVYCWGFNGRGELGAATAQPWSAEPVRVPLPFGAATVAAFTVTCAVPLGVPDGATEVRCWGPSGAGEHGDGQTEGAEPSVLSPLKRQ